jgi:4-azaleucine resistance transporter AzlC
VGRLAGAEKTAVAGWEDMNMSSLTSESSGKWLRDGLSAAWPVCLGYFPIGLSLGVLAQKSGLEPWQMALMSLLVFAGGSQFIAVAMIAAGASLAAIVTTTFMVNLRHLLMSSALSVYFPGVSRRFLAIFAYGVTDESFAVNTDRFKHGSWNRYSALVLNQAANATWFFSTVAGAYAGQFIPAGSFGIDYALTGMFICLLVFQLRGTVFAATSLIAAACSVFCYIWLPGNAYVIVASCLAATAGFALKRIVLITRIIILIICMGIVTYLPRLLPLVALSRRRLPGWFTEWLELIPVAILSALIAPILFASAEPRSFCFGKPELLAAVPTLLFALKTRSLAGTVMVGMLCYWGVKLLG